MFLRLSRPKMEVKQKVIKTKMNRHVIQHPRQTVNTVLIYIFLPLMGGWGRDKEERWHRGLSVYGRMTV